MNDPGSGPASESNLAGPPSPSLIQSVFIGPAGLRAGWRFAIYLLACFVLLRALSLIIGFLFPRLQGLWALFAGECQLLVAAIVPAGALSRVERRPFGSYGLSRERAFGAFFWAGALWGLVSITVLLVAMRGFGAFYFGGLALHGVRILKFAAFWGVLFLIVGLFEEFLFRGYTQFTLAEGIGFWPAAVLLSAAFGAIHLRNQGEAWIGALGAAFIGLFFCLTLRRTRSLWFAAGMHASWDWGETFLYSVPDSGFLPPGHLLNSSFHGPQWLTGGSVG